MNENNIIHSSTDYDSFEFFKGNRPLLKGHVKNLVEDKTFPKNFFSCPIVVNEKKFILDGQHRYTAAKQLGIPIYYIIMHGGVKSDIKNRNINIKNWKLDDYVHYYSNDSVKIPYNSYS